jgi:hypothetical protein
MDYKLYNEEDKVYVDKVEAFEIAMSRGFFELPRKGKEILTCRAVGLGNSILGKDANGYYNVEQTLC